MVVTVTAFPSGSEIAENGALSLYALITIANIFAFNLNKKHQVYNFTVYGSQSIGKEKWYLGTTIHCSLRKTLLGMTNEMKSVKIKY